MWKVVAFFEVNSSHCDALSKMWSTNENIKSSNSIQPQTNFLANRIQAGQLTLRD
jgi:hypothetical protein